MSLTKRYLEGSIIEMSEQGLGAREIANRLGCDFDIVCAILGGKIALPPVKETIKCKSEKTGEEFSVNVFNCPSCEHTLFNEDDPSGANHDWHFCPFCGQLLDRGDN